MKFDLELQQELHPPPSLPPDYFPAPSLEQQLELLLHLSSFGHDLLLLCAAEGAGKSTLLQQLQIRFSQRGRCCL
ncbi:MAG: hypothetical protein HQL48_09515, partial [Gammaproteobacteria bacterium]|nr:hypothetical protein [Gammaproteobacteria bacterium]